MFDIIWRVVKGCPNFSKNGRGEARTRSKKSIKCIILHYTDSSFSSTINTFLNPKDEASAHLVVDRDGSVHELLGPEYMAWHAGISTWRGIKWCNKLSYGIELVAENEVEVGEGRQFTFTMAQYEAVQNLLWGGAKVLPDGTKETLIGLVDQFGLTAPVIGELDAEVLGHEHVSYKRKWDPGPLFDWTLVDRMQVGPVRTKPFESTTTVAAPTLKVGLHNEIDEQLPKVPVPILKKPELSWQDRFRGYIRRIT